MYSTKSELLSDLDATLDQLIENAEVLNQIVDKPQYFEENAALERTQESLLSHALHVSEMVKKCKAPKKQTTVIKEKMAVFSKLRARRERQNDQSIKLRKKRNGLKLG